MTNTFIAFSENSIKFCCHQFQLGNDPQVQGPRHTLKSLEASHIVKSPSWQGAGEGEGGGGGVGEGGPCFFKGKLLKRIFAVKCHQEDRQCKWRSGC